VSSVYISYSIDFAGDRSTSTTCTPESGVWSLESGVWSIVLELCTHLGNVGSQEVDQVMLEVWKIDLFELLHTQDVLFVIFYRLQHIYSSTVQVR
jgi:hypothetical protein